LKEFSCLYPARQLRSAKFWAVATVQYSGHTHDCIVAVILALSWKLILCSRFVFSFLPHDDVAWSFYIENQKCGRISDGECSFYVPYVYAFRLAFSLKNVPMWLEG